MTAARWSLIVGALLSAGRARAEPAEAAVHGAEAAFFGAAAPVADLARARADAFRPPPGASYAVLPGTLGAPLAAVPLAPILDRVRSTRAAFRAGTATVHVFGGKSRNKKDWFVGFAVEGGDAQFRNGRKMIHWALLNRTVRFAVGGRKYSSFVDGKITDKMHSVLVVRPEDKSEAESRWTAQELADDAFDTGIPVTIGGREYRLLYTRDFDQGDDGEFAGYASDRSITLMTREGGRLIGYHWFEREIPSDSILVSSPRAVGADSSGEGALTVGLRRAPGGTLEIYSLAGARVASN